MPARVGGRQICFSQSWLVRCPGAAAVVVAVDDTRLRKTGRRIQSAFYQYDPLSPKFRYNLMFGLRFLQVSLLIPLYRHAKASPRGLPVRFEEAPALKRPRRRAAEEGLGSLSAGRQAAKSLAASSRVISWFTPIAGSGR